MAHTLGVTVNLGAGRSGLTLTATLLNADGTAGPALTTTNLVELAAGSGVYGWTGSIPDAFRGFMQFKSGATFETAVAINPEEGENLNIRTSNVWDELRASHLAAGSFGLALQVARTGTAQAGSATTITLDTGAVSIDNFYNNELLFLAAGTGAGQALFIQSYVGATKVATMNGTWVTPPDSTSVYVIQPFAQLMGGASLSAAQIWNYAVRTLTAAGAVLPPLLSGATLTVLRGDTITINLTGLGSLVGFSKLWFTAKQQLLSPDASALFQIEAAGGLLVLNGAAGTPSQGSLTVTDVNNGNITVTLQAAAAAALPIAAGYHYDVQKLVGTSITTLTAGTLIVSGDVTRATS